MGCGKSKHAVATTESFSSRKKLKASSSKKVQNVEELCDTKATNVNENSNKSCRETLKVDTEQEIGMNANQEEILTTKGKQINIFISNSKLDSPIELKEKPENKDILVSEKVVPNRESEGNDIELSMGSHEEKLIANEIKTNKNLSPQHESIQIFPSNEEEKHDIIVDNELNNNTKVDGNLSPQHEYIVKIVSDEEEKEDKSIDADNELNNKKECKSSSPEFERIENSLDGEEKHDKPIKGDNDLNNKTTFDENLFPGHESIENFSLNEEEKLDNLVEGYDDTNNKEEEKNEDGK
ncbi:hypothetical protein SOVF_212550 [Spinacia oleracea]|nr:hypothetical protein SOVF_212550 [Spinacia oleracea]